MVKFKFLLLLFPLLILVSCGKKYTEEEIQQIVNETDKKVEKLAGQHFDWGDRKAYSTLTAFYPDPDVIFVRENLRYRKHGEAVNIYYFKDGNLVYYVGKELVYNHEKSAKLRKALTHLTLYLNPDGDVIKHEKTINFQEAPLEDSDVENVLEHAEEIYHKVGDQG